MSNFQQATNWLRQGKKVRRPCWEEDSYWTLGVDEIIFWKEESKAVVHLNQIKATDWEIFEDIVKFKTLKEIDSKIKKFVGGERVIFERSLKQEAIKQIKELKRRGNTLGFKQGKLYGNVFMSGERNHSEFFTLARWIQQMFNITEADLK